MAVTQLTDVIIPEELTAYQVENSLVSTALSQSGVVANNALIAAQLSAGPEFWNDLPEVEADITNDDPEHPAEGQRKQTERSQVVSSCFVGWDVARLGTVRGKRPRLHSGRRDRVLRPSG